MSLEIRDGNVTDKTDGKSAWVIRGGREFVLTLWTSKTSEDYKYGKARGL